jgi:ABC-2 type transport system ATP-binding protein
MLEVKNVEKSFGPIKAVCGVTFHVRKGEIVGFLGPNGAGKTTTMRIITGFLPPTSGTATVCGHDIREAPVEAKKCIGYLPENSPLYADMTVSSFLTFIAGIRGYAGKERDRKVEHVVQSCYLEKVRHQVIETLSKGYNQRVGFAQAVLHDPPVLVMDEPTDGLDPNQKHTVRTMIREMSQEKAIVISTHILEEVEAVCSRAVIISDGRIVANGTPDELKARSPSGRLDDVFRELTIGTEKTTKAG